MFSESGVFSDAKLARKALVKPGMPRAMKARHSQMDYPVKSELDHDREKHDAQ
jgi:hypothetical protein